jgi:periplasmic divalent cation tolerance protein
VSTGVVQVSFTHPGRDDLDGLVRDLVTSGLVACGQVDGPVSSVYRWRGAVEEAEEWRAVLKTTQDAAPRVVGAIRSAHPYETPEVVVTPVTGGDPDYLAWVVDESG